MYKKPWYFRFWLRILEFGLWASNFGFLTLNFGLQTFHNLYRTQCNVRSLMIQNPKNIIVLSPKVKSPKNEGFFLKYTHRVSIWSRNILCCLHLCSARGCQVPRYHPSSVLKENTGWINNDRSPWYQQRTERKTVYGTKDYATNS